MLIFEVANLQTTVSALPVDQKSANLPRHWKRKTKIVATMSNMKVIANAKQTKSHCSNQQNKVKVEKGEESDALAKLGLEISLNDWKQLMVKSHYYEQIFNHLPEKLKDRVDEVDALSLRFLCVWQKTECLVSPISSMCFVEGRFDSVVTKCMGHSWSPLEKQEI